MKVFSALSALAAIFLLTSLSKAGEKPNIVLVMADDMGWGETGYYDHPVLKTPNLDAMAANGLRFDRFYAGASNCSPTRATVLTGRSNERTGVDNHGFPLRLQEKTVAQALKAAGYATGHFGKWHLNGLRGPGAPILKDDTHSPGGFGFDSWLSVTNYFDLNPLMSRNGEFEDFEGDSSEIVVAEALKFIAEQTKANKPSFTVIWYGTPHSPFRALEKDKEAFADLQGGSQDHYGELVAMDRSIGTLRTGLKYLDIADNTIVWFCSDNGGLPEVKPDTVGGLREFKGSMYEGGIRVPCVVEWPSVIKPRITSYPAGTVDIFSTIRDIVGLPESVATLPQDGTSLKGLFSAELEKREKPLVFRHQGRPVLIDNDLKLIKPKPSADYELYDLANDPNETKDLIADKPEVAKTMRVALDAFEASVDASIEGKDYPGGKLDPNQPPRWFWRESPAYEPYFKEWAKRPEYGGWIKKPAKK